MYATIAVTNQNRNAIVVPATAVIRDGVSTSVFVQTGREQVRASRLCVWARPTIQP